MPNQPFSIQTLIAVLQTFPMDTPVYVRIEDGNTLPWNGHGTLLPVGIVDATLEAPEDARALVLSTGDDQI